MPNPSENSATEVFVSALTLHQSALRGYCQAALGMGKRINGWHFSHALAQPVVSVVAQDDDGGTESFNFLWLPRASAVRPRPVRGIRSNRQLSPKPVASLLMPPGMRQSVLLL